MKDLPSERTKAALWWLVVIQAVSMGAMDMSGPFWPLHLRDLGGLSQMELAHASTLAYAGPLAMAMWCTPAWGHVADRFGHKPMVLRALLALAFTQAWIAWADSVASILAARLVQGALAGFIAAAQAYASRLTSREERGQLIAKLQVATAVGSVAGPLLGGLLYAQSGFRFVNLLAAGLCIMCTAMAWWKLPAVPMATEATKAPGGKVRSSSHAQTWGVQTMTGLLLGIVAVQTARMLPQAFFGLYAEKALAVSPWVTGSCYGATALGLCVSATAWSRRFARGVRRDILAEAALCAGACALLTLGQLPGVPLPALLAARFLWGVCLGALLPVFYALLSREAPDSRQGMAMGWGNAAAKAGALAGTVLGGTMLGVLPLQWLMMPVAVAYALTALSLWRLRRMGTPSSRDLGLAARSEG